MIEAPAQYPGPDPDDDDASGDETERSEAVQQDVYEMVSGDLKAASILVEAKKVIGATIAAKILSKYLMSAHQGREIAVSANSNVMRDKGRGKNFLRLKKQFEEACEVLPLEQKDQLYDETREYVMTKVLELRPSAVWTTLPASRQMAAVLLRLPPDDAGKRISPNDFAKALSLYLRDTLDLPINKPFSGDPISTLIKKRTQATGRDGRDVLAEELEAGPGEPLPALDATALQKAVGDAKALVDAVRETKHERSPVWRDERARTFVAELLLKEDITIESIVFAVNKYFNLDISAPGINYQIYNNPEGRTGFAKSRFAGVSPEVRSDIRKLARVAKLSCYSFSINAAVEKKMEKYGIQDETIKKRLSSYFSKQMLTPHYVSSVMEAAIGSNEKLMSALAVAKETDRTIRDLVGWGERQNRRLRMSDVYEFAAKRGTVNLNIPRATCDAIFILNGITPRGVMSLVRHGQRSAPQARSLDAPLSQDEDSANLGDLVGSDDPEFERFEARDEMGKLLLAGVQAGLLSEAAVASLKKVVAGEDLDDPGAYDELAAAINAVPELRRLLGMEESEDE